MDSLPMAILGRAKEEYMAPAISLRRNFGSGRRAPWPGRGRPGHSTMGVAFLLLSVVPLFAQGGPEKAWTQLQSGLASKGDERVISVRVLGLLQDNTKASELATAALDDQKPEVRAAAYEALGRMHASTASPKIKEKIKEEKDPSAIMSGGRALISLGDPLGYNVYYAVLTGEKKSGAGLLDEQKKMLNDPKKMAQFGFEQGIGFIPFAGAGMTAVKALTKDDSSPVRAAAAKILAKDPDPKSGAALVEAVSDKSWIVRAAALDALSERGDPAVLAQVEPKLDDDKAVVRYTAAAAVIHLNDVKNRTAANKTKNR